MSGAAGVMSVILLETAVGGAIVMWAGGVWGVVRRGFFILTGIFLALCAAGTWAIAGGEAEAVGTTLAVFTGLLVAWQVLLLAGQEGLSRWVGLAAAVAGVVTLPVVNLLTPLFATAFMVHTFKYIQARDRARPRPSLSLAN